MMRCFLGALFFLAKSRHSEAMAAREGANASMDKLAAQSEAALAVSDSTELGLVKGRAAEASDTESAELVRALRNFVAKQQQGQQSLIGPLAEQLEIEFAAPATQEPLKSKVALVVIEMLGLGILGLDRCYAGQVCLGILKGVTLGACGIWAIIDFVPIIINCLGQEDSIDSLGFNMQFDRDEVIPAFWMVLLMVTIRFCMCIPKDGCCAQGPTTHLTTRQQKQALVSGRTASISEVQWRKIFARRDTNKDGFLNAYDVQVTLTQEVGRGNQSLDIDRAVSEVCPIPAKNDRFSVDDFLAIVQYLHSGMAESHSA